MRRYDGRGRPHVGNRFLFEAIAAVTFLLAACGPPGGASGKAVATLTVTEANATRKVSADGALEAARQVPITPSVPGKVSTVSVENGQTVEAGQTLFQLDAADLQAQLDALDSGGGSSGSRSSSGSGSQGPKPDEVLGGVNTGVDELMLGLNKSLDGLETALTALPAPTDDPANVALRLAIAQQRIYLQYASQTFKMDQQVYMAGQALVAQSNLAFAGALGSLGGASSSSNPQVESQKTQLERQIRDTTIRAPISGLVAFASLPSGTGAAAALAGASPAAASSANSAGDIHPGSQVAAGQTVMSIYDTSGVRVKVGIDEVDVPDVREGQTVDVDVDAFPDTTITGRVGRIDVNPTVSDSGGVAYGVRVDVPADQLQGWRPGMTASVDIKVDEGGGDSGVELPSSAIVPEGDTDYVFKVVDGKAVKTAVKTRKTGTGVVVLDLRPGDVVVTNGANDLTDGDRVSTGPK
ncbi:MAG: efflux RND transporter periplasmic adaptor subunit [Acidimicrobiia bacterium]|nr:efflux RND transporter periplasmic adaptor subunit [Acidimicrobiia bacterium]